MAVREEVLKAKCYCDLIKVSYRINIHLLFSFLIKKKKRKRREKTAENTEN